MDYDDSDFHSQNNHLAGEGTTKFPLQPCAIPKFDFDDSLHGHLRFENLVETEVFLGIQSNEDNQWIEEFSRGNSGIEFNSSAAESCTISRRKNVWSEATSSESVEMLLESVGQEEIIPAHPTIRELDACDELGCLIKQMEPSSKKDSICPPKSGDITDLCPTVPPDEIPGIFSGLNQDVVVGQLHVEGTSQSRKDESSGDAQHQINISDTSRDDMQTDSSKGGKKQQLLSQEALVNDQNLNGTVVENCDSHSEDLLFPASVEIAEEGNIVEARMINLDKPSNLSLKRDLDLPMVEGCSEGIQSSIPSQARKLEDVVLLKDSEIDDQCQVSACDVSPMTFEGYSNFEGHEVEGSKTNTEIGITPEPKMESVAKLTYGQDDTVNKEDFLETSSLLDDKNLVSEHETSLLSMDGHKASNNDGNADHREVDVCECHENDSVDKEERVGFNPDHVIMESEVVGSSIVDKGLVSLSLAEEKNELAVAEIQPNATVGKESASDITLENASLACCGTTDGIPTPLGDGLTTDAITDPKEVQKTTLPVVVTNHTNKEKSETKISMEATNLESSSQVKGEVCPISASEKGASYDTAKQFSCKAVDYPLSVVDGCNTENQIKPQTAVTNKCDQECIGATEIHSVISASTMGTSDNAEALVTSEKHVEVIVKENYAKEIVGVSDSVLTSNEDRNLISLEEGICDTGQEIPKEHEAVLAAADKSSGDIAVTMTDDDPLKIIASSSTPSPSKSQAKLNAVESGSNSRDDDKLTFNAPAAAAAAAAAISMELSQSETGQEGVSRSTNQYVSVSQIIKGDTSQVLSVPQGKNGNDISKGDSSFTFEVSSLSDLSRAESGKKSHPSSIKRAKKITPIVEGSPSTSAKVQSDPRFTQDVPQVNLKVPDVEVVHGGSKGTPRRTRRASGKTTAKENARKGNLSKETTAVRQSEMGEKVSNASVTSSGIRQLAQSNEIQRYGHVHSSSSGIKPFAITTSASGLLDWSSSTSASVVLHQPFTDLQQVQLRAQIFVYGALIQGTAPDEAYMISAFGGPDGGKSIWENAWHACIERLHGKKSHLNPETPLQSRSAARAPDTAIKQSALHTPVGLANSKGTPMIFNPTIPHSSPLWSIPTPGDGLQISGLPRGGILDYQRALSPLQPHQTPPMRNIVGSNSAWISQSPFTLVASPLNSAFDTIVHPPVLPITEAVKLASAREPPLPQSYGVKHLSSSPIIQNVASASLFSGISPMLDGKKVTGSSGLQSTEPKSRKRRKNVTPEDLGQNVLHSQPGMESVSAPTVTKIPATSVHSTNPTSFVSKVSAEKLITSLSSTSTNLLTKDAEPRAFLSEETLSKVKEARAQAENAAALAAASVSQSQEMWSLLVKQSNSGLPPDVETKLASAAVAISAAAAVAKAAAAAANVASNAALQAKMMADEAFISSATSNPSQSDAIFLSETMRGTTTPSFILKGGNGTNNSSSILVAAREAARRRIEAASAASKQAENMDAIVKAAELAAEAVSQAGKIVAMGDPLPLSELVATDPEGYWKVSHVSSDLIMVSNDVVRESFHVDSVTDHLRLGPLDKKEYQSSSQGKSPTVREMYAEHVEGLLASDAAGAKDPNGQKGHKTSDSAKTIDVVPESESGSKSLINMHKEATAEAIKEKSIKEGSHVEVFKEGDGFKAAWFSANVLSLKDGKAYVCYTELALDGGPEKLKEWVAIKGEGDEAPKVRIARPITAMPFEGTRKRRRVAMGDYSWSVGDRVDAWMQDSWREGVVTEKNKKDETLLTLNFSAQGETSVVRAWHLRPSLIWKDGEWTEWSNLGENVCFSHEGDTPREKRPRIGSPLMEVKGQDKTSKSVYVVESDKPEDTRLLDLSMNEKIFNIGKSTRDEKKPDTLRMIRTGLQKEGSRLVFGVPKPGKKRKFMDVSKHYVADKSIKINESNDSVKFAKYQMPQGSGSRGWKNTNKIEPKEKRLAAAKPKVLKSGKQQSLPGRAVPQKDNLVNAEVSTHGDAVTGHAAKTRDSVSQDENISGKTNLLEFQSFSRSSRAGEGPVLFSSLPPPSDVRSSKKNSIGNLKSERANKEKLAPADGRLGKIEEEKVFSGNSVKPTTDVTEPRRSNRRIQPTSRLLEGLQSSMITSKIPSASHDKSHRRSASRGNNHG
ncbi:platelet binding protein GspB isoform X1 [Tripterygium wilfordii]|uniref:platelet binding protein GspB isoform X1 n=1 Tax=Tripterygium wilfordii TaxID=458696 RepID=UPI0018F81F7E|nr:platelet binding protein GspB isoform X1 [Tripterygium wilfordii]XP_038688246.1 platelet binding protein GspB isoform X1 [Tripterygium wilfordii]XP_038688247.1 platelet binding protein GspB isoform X1 [Tripterygium wilfordii]XP_038688248.1 platelet binding protein GspB isoform X1 [Tripterygium wilfordii]XP_038688249.1 platelet binding protein GspB isoform X1 [Tripterygium wilfordii]XP_038688250.1 platelet binding protein GspB isoform X1 [Tripterygium wilfordii]XP_038688251.1 platelet bindi